MFFVYLILSWVFFHNQSLATQPDQSKIAQSAQSSEWKKLLHYRTHYRKNFLRPEKSLLHDSKFFLSPDGNNNAQNELIQNLQAFKQDPQYSCRFPARAAWLSHQFQISYSECAAVTEWRQKINAKTVALVHVNQYVSNPSSAFGHSFFLFQNPSRPLNMDMAFNNAAEIPEQIGIWDYVTKGLFGGFPGIYTLEPFYLKIQEYGHIENRDMWIYRLNLTEDEVQQLLNHLWEVTSQSTEPYYFLNQNCSVNIFNALAATQANLEFVSESKVYVLPVEALQKIQPLVTEKIYLPSLREKIVQKQKYLLKSKSPKIEQAEINLDIFEFKKSQNAGELKPEDAKSYGEQLVQRSKLGVHPDPMPLTSPPPPDGAVPSWRWALGWKKENDENLMTHSFAFFSHELVQKSDGYIPRSEIVVFKFDGSQNIKNQFFLDEMTLFKMTNFPISADFDPQQSYRIFTGFSRPRHCTDCFFPLLEATLGKSLVLNNKHLMYGMLGVLEEQDQVLLPELVLGSISDFSEMIINFEFQRLQDVSSHQLNEDRLTLKAGIPLSHNLDVQIKIQSGRHLPFASAQLGLGF